GSSSCCTCSYRYRYRCRRLRRSGGCLRRSGLGALGIESGIDGGGFRRVNLVVVLVRLRQLVPIEHQAAEAVIRRQIELYVHLDGVERADLNADLARHADRNVDIEPRRVELRLAHRVRLLVLAFLDEDALRRAFLLADLAGNATHPRIPFRAVVDEKRKVARSLDLRQLLFGILHRGQAVFRDVAAEKVTCRLRETFEDAVTEHGWPPARPSDIEKQVPRLRGMLTPSAPLGMTSF